MATWTITVAMLLTLSAAQIHIKVKAAKIVFLPLAMGNSPYFIFIRMAEELQARGHKTSIITTNLLRKRDQSIVRHVDYPVNITNAELSALLKGQSGGEKGSKGLLSAIPLLLKVQVGCCEDLLQNSNAMDELKTADMIIVLPLAPCTLYVANYLNKPFISVHPAAFNVVGFLTQVPLPPSYVPLIHATDRMTFFQRTLNFLAATSRNVAADFLVSLAFRNIATKLGEGKSFGEIFAQAEMHLVTADFAVEFAHPLMPNVFHVGPVLPKPAAKLPANLEEIMKESGEHGVILISFGSQITSINDKILAKIVKAIAGMKQTVIWKVKLPDHIQVPSNLRIFDWIPQNDLLGHAKMRAFVSHMGINGAYEAAFHAVPLVAACLMSDSFQNALRFIEKAKMAKFIDVYGANSSTWQSTLEEVIYNLSYKRNAVKVSKLIRSHPRSAVEKTADLIDHALINGGRLPHLKAYANQLSWYQYFCLDVIAFLVFIAVVVIFAVTKVMRCIYRLIKSMIWNKKVKKN